MGVLLDTHALLWLVNGRVVMSAGAQFEMARQQRDGALVVSQITGWELAVAMLKAAGQSRPDLGGESAERWFRNALDLTGAKLARITNAVAFEAARVPQIYGRRDPGDCFLIATARVRKIPIITRDAAMIALAQERPDYLTVIAC
jgi:PIN domain nuclease of toxin-antitoxin system